MLKKQNRVWWASIEPVQKCAIGGKPNMATQVNVRIMHDDLIECVTFEVQYVTDSLEFVCCEHLQVRNENDGETVSTDYDDFNFAADVAYPEVCKRLGLKIIEVV